MTSDQVFISDANEQGYLYKYASEFDLVIIQESDIYHKSINGKNLKYQLLSHSNISMLHKNAPQDISGLCGNKKSYPHQAFCMQGFEYLVP